jgi:glycerophosphoryl diester phosphodiesterase
MFQYIVVPLSSLTPELVKETHARGIKILVYTVNERADILHARECGVDGIISDNPDLVRYHRA